MDTELKSDNKGRAMLEKMGWKEGSGLGKDGAGRQEPVKVEQRVEGAGLGSASAPLPSVQPGAKRKMDIRLKNQKRFMDAPLLGAFNNDNSGDDEEKTT